MSKEIRCIGCGSVLQDQDPKAAGYMPTSALKKAQAGAEEVYCKRCFRLRHYNEINPVAVHQDDFLKTLSQLGQKPALVVNVVDLFDFNGSLLTSLPRFIGNNDFILVGNKADLFPPNLRVSKLKDWMRQQANKHGLYPKKIFLLSAKSSNGLDELVSYLDKAGKTKDIYFAGVTNVGKSTLVNAILKQASGEGQLITTSSYPGTTLAQIEIPLASGHQLVDTPGILSDSQLASRLSPASLKLVTPKKRLKPKTYQLLPGQTLFISGLARIDFLQGKANSFVVYCARDLVVHRTKTSNADEFYEKHKGELLQPPTLGDDLPALRGQDYSSREKSDLLLGGLGFVTIPTGVTVRSYTPGGIGQGIRRALI